MGVRSHEHFNLWMTENPSRIGTPSFGDATPLKTQQIGRELLPKCSVGLEGTVL